MKNVKKFLMLMGITVMTLSFVACGGADDSDADQSSDDVIEEEITDKEIGAEEDDTEEADVTNEEESDPEEETDAESETVTRDGYLDEFEITITPQGSVTYTTELYESLMVFYRWDDDLGYEIEINESDYNPETDYMEYLGTNKIGDIDLTADVEFEENNDGCDEGFKNIICTITSDLTDSGDYGVDTYICIFDRYTGKCFLCAQDMWREYDRFDPDNEGWNVDIEFNSEKINIHTKPYYQYNEPISLKTFTITCPEDYDGLVLMMGYNSPSYWEDYEEDKNLYDFSDINVDQLPAFPTNGLDYYFFTPTND